MLLRINFDCLVFRFYSNICKYLLRVADEMHYRLVGRKLSSGKLTNYALTKINNFKSFAFYKFPGVVLSTCTSLFQILYQISDIVQTITNLNNRFSLQSQESCFVYIPHSDCDNGRKYSLDIIKIQNSPCGDATSSEINQIQTSQLSRGSIALPQCS